jgi:glycosyltransferase involved in cell wall biosynthesis
LLENDTIMHDNWLVRLLEWNDSGDVEWLGWRDDMPELIRNRHVVGLPSYYGGGVPRILIEAAASGRPIVTTNSSGCREVVRNRENGFLVPPHDIGALVDSIATLLDSPSLRLTMGKRGRERAVDEFGLARATDANVEVYCSLLNSRDRSSKCSVLLNRDVHANPRISCPEADILRIRTHR